MVSSFLPYPLFNGGNIRLYNLIKHLSKKHEITLICERRKNQTEEDVEEVKKYCKKVITFPRKKQWSFSNILKAGFSLEPFLIVGHTNSEMKRRIKHELIENNFDLIHVETFYVLQNLPKTSIPIVLVEHNIEYMVYRRFVRQMQNWLKPLLNLDILKLRKKEVDAWKKATALVSVSEKEKEAMSFVKKDISVVPNGVDLESFKFKDSSSKTEQREKRILFIGDFKWIENVTSAKWIIREIWPKIKVKFNSKLWIVGQNIPDELKRVVDKDIYFDSNLKDTAKIYERAYILLSPIRVGGGTSFKILEAMACGIPVVTTSLGAEGIGKDVLVAETSQELADRVGDLFLDSKLYETIAKNARKLVEEKYDWKIISAKLEKVYSKVTQND